MISGTNSSCRPVTRGVSQGLVLRPILFNVVVVFVLVFFKDLGDGTEGTFSKCAEDKTGMVDTSSGVTCSS